MMFTLYIGKATIVKKPGEDDGTRGVMGIKIDDFRYRPHLAETW